MACRAHLIGILLAALLLPVAQAAPIVVQYPRSESERDPRKQYCFQILQMALERAGGTHVARLSQYRMPQARAALRLQRGEEIHVFCSMTTAAREHELLAIPIPIDKGLLGWRLMLINKDDAGRWSRSISTAEIKAMTAGQGSDWPDTSILRSNGYTVYATSSYDSLFSMLANKRLDYFPRSVSEVWDEADAHKARLTVEPALAFRYTTASYLFVRKGDTELAVVITRGLDKMIADGSFEKMFQEQFGPMIKRSRLRERRIIELHNPLLPNGVPQERRSLLFRG